MEKEVYCAICAKEEQMEVRVKFEEIKECFASLPDPRVVGRTAHGLVDILFLTLCAVLCGMEDWEAIEDWGNEKLEWLRGFIELKNGIPSHDTIGRVFAALDSVVFQECSSSGWRACALR